MTSTDATQPSLEDLFRRHAHRRWYFVSPGGNWGDHLIYEGAFKLANRAGLERVDLTNESFAEADPQPETAIYLHGSGGFNNWGSRRAFANLARALRSRATLVIQGPHTCATDDSSVIEELASQLAEPSRAASSGAKAPGAVNTGAPGTTRGGGTKEVHLFAREQASAGLLERLRSPSTSVHLEQDTALNLTCDDLLELAELTTLPRGRYRLQVVRQDRESRGRDHARGGSGIRLDPAYFARSFAHWVRIHAFASEVTTDRLHSAIAAVTLGKPVTLSGGSYHKNRSVWEYSLRQRGVRWLDENDSTRSRSDGLRLPARLENSWKLLQLRCWLSGLPLR